MVGLEHYNAVSFQNDFQHLQHCHIEYLHEKTEKRYYGRAFGLNVGYIQNALPQIPLDTDSDTSDSESIYSDSSSNGDELKEERSTDKMQVIVCAFIP